MKNMEILGGWRVGVALGAIGLFMLSVPDYGQAATGDLDPTFGGGGKVTTDFGGGDFDVASALALQPDGKIVVAGSSGDAAGKSNFALARYTASGSLDPTFAGGGKVLTDFGGDDRAFALALQPDGKIVVAGVSNAAGNRNFALARYTANGSLDPTFAGGGKVLTDFGGGSDGATALALQPDGKIVVAGFSNAAGNFNFVALARYTANGSLDPTFAGGGKVLTDFGGDDGADALALQPDGKIVVVGGSVDAAGNSNFALARYTANGSLDPAFAGGGKVLTDFGGDDRASALALQPDGKIVVAGFSNAAGNFNFALARYTANGSLDPTFADGGKVLTDFGGGSDGATALALQPDGKIVVAGSSVNAAGNVNFALARYTANGSPDASFGVAGKVLTDFGGDDVALALVLQADGKIVVAGPSFAAGNVNVALARYRGDPMLFLGLTLNRSTVAVGDLLQLNTGEANSGPTTTVDKYVGAALPPESGPVFGCPANDPVAFVTESRAVVLTCLSAPPQIFPPFARNVTLPADLPLTVTNNLFSVAWPAGAPPGPYVFFEAFLRTGSVADGSLDTGDLLALATAAVRSPP